MLQFFEDHGVFRKGGLVDRGPGVRVWELVVWHHRFHISFATNSSADFLFELLRFAPHFKFFISLLYLPLFFLFIITHDGLAKGVVNIGCGELTMAALPVIHFQQDLAYAI